MKKVLAFILFVLTAIGAYTALRGKNDSETSSKPAMCFVVEADDLFGFDFELLRDEIHDVVVAHGYIRAVCADARPSVYVDIDVPVPEKKYTKSKVKKINEQITDNIITELNNIAPKTAEDDLLRAIKIGKQTLNRCRDASSKEMVVISSGILRAGALCFQDYGYETNGRKGNSLLATGPEKVVALLSENNAIPDLSSIDGLLWYGCGAAAGDQHIPDSAAAKIQDLWDHITETAGCQAEFDDMALTDEPFDTDLRSTVIDFGEDEIKIDPPAIDIKFDESQLGFIANEAVLRDEGTAVELLKPYASKIIEYSESANLADPDPVLYVVGLTATFGDPERCKKLSLARADTVKGLLVSAGCPEELIGTLGLGQGGPASMRTDDTIRTDDPEALEALRAQNRVVYLIGTGSEKAELLGLN